ncbi:MAG: S8 family peptidase [Bacillota bacterium]|jgi:subtilisin family serine protease
MKAFKSPFLILAAVLLFCAFSVTGWASGSKLANTPLKTVEEAAPLWEIVFDEDVAIPQEALADNNMTSYIEDGEDSGTFFTSDEKVVKRWQKSDLVEEINPKNRVHLAATPNDPLYSKNNGTANYQWALHTLEAASAWDITTGSSQVKVAVIDSGLQANHPDKGSNIIGAYDAVSDQKSVSGDPANHGTAVAGLIAAGTNNHQGMAGSNWQCTVYAINIFYYDSYLKDYTSTDEYLNRAIRYAVDNLDVDVINMSYASLQENPLEKQAIAYARQKGVILVAAVDNNGDQDGSLKNILTYPANYQGVIGVGATNKNSKKAGFSSANSSVDVSAPGEAIISLNSDLSSPYSLNSGTSFSAPLVSGLAALAKAIDRDLSPANFEKFLQISSTDLGNPGRDDQYGHGLINYYDFLDRLKNYRFYDIKRYVWYEDSVYYLVDQGIVNGTTKYTYSPNKLITRAHFAKMLAESSGEDLTKYATATCPFKDVTAASQKAYINWAYQNGVVKGVSKTAFAPNSYITRQDLVLMLYNYLHNYMKEELPLTSPDIAFKDENNISPYAKEAVHYMVKADIIHGTTSTTFSPKDNSLRSVAAHILAPFLQILD